MTKNRTYTLIISLLFALSCARNSGTERWQTDRDNIVDVAQRIKCIDTKDVYISQMSTPYLVDKYLLITDYKSMDRLIHIFDKNTFRYVTSRINKGRGPAEIISIGNVTSSKQRGEIYVSDNGKQAIYTYSLDSLLKSNSYVPRLKLSHSKKYAIADYEYINDTLSVGLAIVGLGSGDFKASVVAINFETGDVEFMKYEHPDIVKPRFDYAASLEHNIYVESFAHHNLMTICDLSGNLKYNIYGDGWSTEVSNENKFYGKTVICKDRIVASFAGKERLFRRDDGSTGVNFPDKLIVFDIDGNYLKTLNLGHQIHRICYDEEGDRLIFSLQNDLHQFAYLELDGLLNT
ncbi:MAG: BF3164 family lipoprotein [Rikenellaceae bacterium]